MAAVSLLGDSCTEITAKTVSFVTYGAYAYNGFNGSIVLCTRVGDELYFSISAAERRCSSELSCRRRLSI